MPARAHARTRGLEDLRGGGKSTPRLRRCCAGSQFGFRILKPASVSSASIRAICRNRNALGIERKRQSGFLVSRLARIISRKPPAYVPLSNRTVAASPYLATWCVRVPPSPPSARRQRVLVATDDARVALRARLPSSSFGVAMDAREPTRDPECGSATRAAGATRGSRRGRAAYSTKTSRRPPAVLAAVPGRPRWRRLPSSVAGRGVKNLATRGSVDSAAIRPSPRGSPARARPSASVVRGRTRGGPTKGTAAALDGGRRVAATTRCGRDAAPAHPRFLGFIATVFFSSPRKNGRRR